MNQTPVRKKHPKGLYVLFATEMWERFNYYGMRAILIYFMTEALLFKLDFASNLYGSYISLLYLTPLVGGYVADRIVCRNVLCVRQTKRAYAVELQHSPRRKPDQLPRESFGHGPASPRWH